MCITLSSSITEWLMVFITLGYTIFTVLIFISNQKSVQEMRAQIQESEREHKETLRTSVLPILQYVAIMHPKQELDYDNCNILGKLEISNTGQQNAIYVQLFTSSMLEGNGHWYIKYNQIEAGQTIEYVITEIDFKEFPSEDLEFVVLYSDIMNNHYAQCILIGFTGNDYYDDEDNVVTSFLESRDFWIRVDKVYAPKLIKQIPQKRDELLSLVSTLKEDVLYNRFQKMK